MAEISNSAVDSMAPIMNMGVVVAENNGVLPCLPTPDSPTFGPKVATL